MLEKLKKYNPNIPFYDVFDKAFQTYGKILTDYNCEALISYMEKHTSIPSEGNQYIPSDENMEKLPISETLKENIFGNMDIQVGYCNGNNYMLNALEFHKSSEINIAITDIILLLGKTQDITQNYTYNTSKIQAFYIPKGTIFEIYGETLHFSPCKVSDEGFKTLVILLKDTNTKLEIREKKDPLLFMKNKWILIHPSFERFKSLGAFIGLEGENITVNYKEGEYGK